MGESAVIARLPRAVTRSWRGVTAAGLGAVYALAATYGFALAPNPSATAAALILHVLATLLAAQATVEAGASRSDVVLFTAAAAALPGVGALAALWYGASGGPQHATNAHAGNEPPARRSERNPSDLQRELAVNSHSQVVRHGSLEEKRNLLRLLAQLGTPRHIAIVRQFLFENEAELRLCAYAELARIGRRHEESIGRLRLEAEAATGAQAGDALAALAGANRDYAVSGVLDREMAGYWSEQAEEIARRALRAHPDCRAAQRVLALVLADRGEADGAHAIVSAWPREFDEASELVRAEVAFHRRDGHACRVAAARLEAAGRPVPEWLLTAIGAEVAA